MKASKKSSGFFIIEILIVLIIVGILVIAMLPNYTTYTQRAKFVDNINAASAIRPAVDGCILQYYSPGALQTMPNCNQTVVTSGIPVTTYGTPNVLSVVVAGSGVITATAQAGVFGGTAYTYVLTPNYNANGQVTWVDTGTCKTAGLC